jgi:site-specific DNA-methyltransferase (adenine-specific)
VNIAACLSSEKDDWLTPPEVLDQVRRFAPIHLDPCTTPRNPVGADSWYALENGDDGLAHPWQARGLVYANPPYGRGIGAWVEKAAREAMRGAEIIALLPARTDSRWFQTWVFQQAAAICWWRGRIKFVGAENSAPFPSALVYYGKDVGRYARVMGLVGMVSIL